MPGLFDSLPAPSRGAEPPALGKRPSEPSADDSSKKARSDATSESELASASSGGAAVAAAAAGAAAAALHCTALQAAYSEDAGARLTMEGVWLDASSREAAGAGAAGNQADRRGSHSCMREAAGNQADRRRRSAAVA